RTVTFQSGQVLQFAFPASAAGKHLVLREVDDKTLGRDGDFPDLIEMLPHGTTFSPPVRVAPEVGAENGFLVTFADAASADTPVLLPVAADGLAYELAHFS